MHRSGYVVVGFIKILTTKTIYHIILICVIYYCMTEKVETLEETIENNFNKIINDNLIESKIRLRYLKSVKVTDFKIKIKKKI